MDRAGLIEMFKRTASEVAEKDFAALTEDDVLADMGVASLQMLEMVAEMERALGTHIPAHWLV